MGLVDNINFETLKSDLEGMTFFVWGDVQYSFFVAQCKTEKDNAHIHMIVSDNDLNTLKLTFVAKGKKQHSDAKFIDGNPQEDKDWRFEYENTEFDGEHIETALNFFGAKEGDAKSVQVTFSAITAALGMQRD